MAAAGFVLDTGALLALESGDARVRALLRQADQHGLPIAVPAGVVAQAWRGGPRQAVIARFLNAVETEVIVLDDMEARAVGVACGLSGHADVVDVHVALVARERRVPVVTSDPGDLASVDSGLDIIAI